MIDNKTLIIYKFKIIEYRKFDEINERERSGQPSLDEVTQQSAEMISSGCDDTPTMQIMKGIANFIDGKDKQVNIHKMALMGQIHQLAMDYCIKEMNGFTE